MTPEKLQQLSERFPVGSINTLASHEVHELLDHISTLESENNVLTRASSVSAQDMARLHLRNEARLTDRKLRKHIDVLSCKDCGKLAISVNDVRQTTDGPRGHGGSKCSGSWKLLASSETL